MHHIEKARRLHLAIIAGLVVTMLALVGAAIIHHLVETQRLDAESVAFRERLEIGYGDDAKVSDFLAHLNGTLVEDLTIATDNLGEQKVTFEYINVQNNRRHVSFVLNVIDDTPPVIYASQDLTLTVGSAANLTDILLSVDDLDDRPTREIIGYYDLDRIGTYLLEYCVTDASGNQTRQPLTLHVVQSTDSHNPIRQSSKLSFAEIASRYKTNDTSIGIDVSSWQGEIDWSAVKAAGVEFAFIRIGYQTGYGGQLVLDKYFEANISAANAIGLPVGVYLYSTATSIDEAITQAEWVKLHLAPYTAELGVAFDWENWSDFNRANVSLRTLNQMALSYLDHLAAAGYRGFLYGSKNYLEKFWQIDAHETWLAQYYDRPTYSRDWTVWQLSDSGRVDGIDGDVDLDLLRRSR